MVVVVDGDGGEGMSRWWYAVVGGGKCAGSVWEVCWK